MIRLSRVALSVLASLVAFAAAPALAQQDEPTSKEDTPIGDAGNLPIAQGGKTNPVGRARAIEVSGVSTAGESVIFPNDYKGKIVLVHVWATWCPHCKKELPQWQRAWEKFHDESFDVLGIAIDAAKGKKQDVVTSFLKDNKIAWTNIFDQAPQLAANLGVESIPYVMVCDGDTGEVLFRGSDVRGKKLIPLLRPIIAAKNAENQRKDAATQPAKPDDKSKKADTPKPDAPKPGDAPKPAEPSKPAKP